MITMNKTDMYLNVFDDLESITFDDFVSFIEKENVKYSFGKYKHNNYFISYDHLNKELVSNETVKNTWTNLFLNTNDLLKICDIDTSGNIRINKNKFESHLENRIIILQQDVLKINEKFELVEIIGYSAYSIYNVPIFFFDLEQCLIKIGYQLSIDAEEFIKSLSYARKENSYNYFLKLLRMFPYHYDEEQILLNFFIDSLSNKEIKDYYLNNFSFIYDNDGIEYKNLLEISKSKSEDYIINIGKLGINLIDFNNKNTIYFNDAINTWDIIDKLFLFRKNNLKSYINITYSNIDKFFDKIIIGFNINDYVKKFKIFDYIKKNYNIPERYIEYIYQKLSNYNSIKIDTNLKKDND